MTGLARHPDKWIRLKHGERSARYGRYSLTVYRTANQPPWFTWNRYPSRTIGAAVRVGQRRSLSVTWARP